MAAPKWLCVALMVVLLGLSMCSATMVKSLRFSSHMSDRSDESKPRHILTEIDDHEHGSGRDIVLDGGAGGGGGGWSSGGSGFGFGQGSGGSNMPGNGGGGGGGGWSSGGSGYGYGSGSGSSGGGGGGGGGWSSGSGGGQGYGYGSGYGFDNEFYPPGFVPGPFHCQPITCGHPNGCPGFVFHFTANKPAAVKDNTNDAVANDPSKENTGS